MRRSSMKLSAVIVHSTDANMIMTIVSIGRGLLLPRVPLYQAFAASAPVYATRERPAPPGSGWPGADSGYEMNWMPSEIALASAIQSSSSGLSFPSLRSRNRGLDNIGIAAFATRIHGCGRITVSRPVVHPTVGISRDGICCGSNIRIRTARIGCVDSAINVVARDPRCSAGLP